MKEIKRTALVPYAPNIMYDLVNDVANYPEFLPWCKGAEVLESSSEEMLASVMIAKAGIHKQFTTRNTLTLNKRIDMHLEKGPFKHLQGYWLFDDIQGQGCKVTLDLAFEVENGLMGKALRKVFETAANAMVNAFCDRARSLYGKS